MKTALVWALFYLSSGSGGAPEVLLNNIATKESCEIAAEAIVEGELALSCPLCDKREVREERRRASLVCVPSEIVFDVVSEKQKQRKRKALIKSYEDNQKREIKRQSQIQGAK